MKFCKADERDIDAAGDAMSVLNDISCGYYPQRNGDECDDAFFDEEDPAHLRKFYDLMKSTVDKAPGWPLRVIGGMCYVILYEKNEIVDPSADVLEPHPRFAAIEKQRDEMLAALIVAREFISADRTALADCSIDPQGRMSDDDAAAVADYDKALLQIDAAIQKATGGAA